MISGVAGAAISKIRTPFSTPTKAYSLWLILPIATDLAAPKGHLSSTLGVSMTVDVWVDVGVGSDTIVGIGEGVGSAVAVGVEIGEGVGSAVAVGVEIGEGVGSAVAVGVEIGEGVGSAVAVGVEIDSGVTVEPSAGGCVGVILSSDAKVGVGIAVADGASSPSQATTTSIRRTRDRVMLRRPSRFSVLIFAAVSGLTLRLLIRHKSDAKRSL